MKWGVKNKKNIYIYIKKKKKKKKKKGRGIPCQRLFDILA